MAPVLRYMQPLTNPDKRLRNMNSVEWQCRKIYFLEYLRKIYFILRNYGPSKGKRGSFTYGRPRILTWGITDVSIGKFCSLASGINIVGGEHNTNWVSTFPLREQFLLPGHGKAGHPKTKGPIIIGNDVWIGIGVTILSGVKIGDGSVVAAQSVVTKDIPPYAIAAGNPAQVVKYRFNQDTIQALLRIQWWNWDLRKILANVALLNGADIQEFVRKFDPQLSENSIS